MKLVYNDIPMRVLEIHDYERVAVYDPSNTDLLYMAHRLNASCAVYPNGYPAGLAQQVMPVRVRDEMLSRAPQVLGAGPQVARGFVGAVVPPPKYDGPKVDTTVAAGTQPGFVTDKVAMYRLGLPRKKLKLSAYHPDGREYVWLESPRPGSPVDAANGPHVMSVSPGAPSGEGTALTLNFQVETAIPPVDIEAERPILSHRWSTEISHDENYYPTRHITGLVVFNAAVLQNYPWHPDSLRNQLFHPIPLGYRRGLGPITYDEAALTLRYEFTDTLVECVFDPANTGATQMEIVEDIVYKSPLF